MPSQSHSGASGDPWARCDRCGQDYHLSQMTMQNGLLLCNEKCLDGTLMFKRERVISEVVGMSSEEMRSIQSDKRQQDNSQYENS